MKKSKNHDFWELVIPIFLNNLFISIMGSVDVFLLSAYSDDAVAATGIVGRVIYILTMLFEIIGVGATILLAQNLGADRKREAKQLVGTAIFISVVQGLILGFLILAVSENILNLLNVDNKIYDDALIYLKYMGVTLIFRSITSVLSGTLRCYGYAKSGMAYTIIGNIVNILGDYLVIFGKINLFNNVIEGVAFFTLLGYAICGVLYFIKAIMCNLIKFRINTDYMKEIYKVGIPQIMEGASYNLSQFFITYIISRLGWEYVSAQVYAMNIMGIISRFSYSTGETTGIMIGKLVGARKDTQAFAVCKKNALIAEKITLALTLLCIPIMHNILGALTDNSYIMHIALVFVYFECFTLIAKTINFVYGNALKASGDIYYAPIIGMIFMWSIGTLGAYLLGIVAGFGVIGICAMFMLDESIRSLLLLRRWKNSKWLNKRLIVD